MDLTEIRHLQSFPRTLLKEVTLVDRLDSLLEDMNVVPRKLLVRFDIDSASRPRGIFAASTLGELSGKSLCGKYPMGCGRKLYYDYTRAEQVGAWEPQMRRRLDEGTALHALIQAYLELYASEHSATESFQKEVVISPRNNPVADQYDISGHVDGVYEVNTPEGRVRFGVEIKTISDTGFRSTNGAHAEHIMQGTVYQKCLDLPLMLFLYWNVNDASLAEYIVQYDEDRWRAIADKINAVRDSAMSNEPPPQEVSYSCRNCKYKGICKPPKVRGMSNAAVASAFRNTLSASREPKE